MKYSNRYLQTRDIDWFCQINQNYVHIASFGGLIPDKINDRARLRLIQKTVSGLPYLFEESELFFNDVFFSENIF